MAVISETASSVAMNSLFSACPGGSAARHQPVRHLHDPPVVSRLGHARHEGHLVGDALTGQEQWRNDQIDGVHDGGSGQAGGIFRRR